MTSSSLRRLSALALAAASLATTVFTTGCAPLMVGGAFVGSTMLITDRRTSGAQLEDQGIELKAMNRLREALGDRGHVSVTSYNRMVLLTGEVPDEALRATAEQTVAKVDNVRSTVNELAVMGSSSLTSRSNDAIISSKIKATLVDAKDLQASTFKVVTERGNVYLMGRVTEREAQRGTDLTRSVSGVQKVIKLFEIITEAELADMAPKDTQDAKKP